MLPTNNKKEHTAWCVASGPEAEPTSIGSADEMRFADAQFVQDGQGIGDPQTHGVGFHIVWLVTPSQAAVVGENQAKTVG